MKIYSISDMHGQLEGLDPKGMDLVLIAGDFARLERLDFIGVCNQVNWVQHKFCAWCANYPQTQFRLIPGNHDICEWGGNYDPQHFTIERGLSHCLRAIHF